MLRIKRRNRELLIDDRDKATYLSDGYDVIDDKGHIVEPATGGKTISYAEHLAEINALKARIKPDQSAELEALKDKLQEAEKTIHGLKTELGKLKSKEKKNAEAAG
ncbi:hypothetical protein [Holdemania massiliensis]|uniref:hypothetical protein n=1 Tax=Holdemania massiliensis TaxID=1468449 RepID=UPI001F0631B6|nr:hypothetical protein [Holdemania massiliensis]MCH1940526.1 hypothetical protein [Holdemania massiliensis]